MEAGGRGVGGTTSLRSILDKPLKQLTEDDISQVTREDCRNYLKQKGMRRPSWNKSQAIQQVISLKALLETSDDAGAGALRRILVPKRPLPPPPPPGTPSSGGDNSGKEASVEPNASSVSGSRDESFSWRRNDSPKTIPPAVVQLDTPRHHQEIAGDDKSSPPTKCIASASGSVGQMTIFYDGKVNVYDGVRPDKARAIMHLAASPVQLSLDDLPANVAFSSPSSRQIQGDKRDLFPHDCAMSPTMQTEKLIEHSQFCRERGNVPVDPDVGGQASRKVSLQRYFEKKRDRGRFKGKKTFGTCCPSLELFPNHHNRTHATSGHLMTGSPSQPRANSQEKIANFSVDLNEVTQEF